MIILELSQYVKVVAVIHCNNMFNFCLRPAVDIMKWLYNEWALWKCQILFLHD